jgi:hypothetical protein
MPIKFKDTSSYSQGTVKRVPKTFEAYVGCIKLVVTRHIDYEPEDWVIRAEPFVKDVVSNVSADEAQRTLVESLRAALRSHLSELD